MKVRAMKISIIAGSLRAAKELEQALWSYGDSVEEEISIRVFVQTEAFLKDCQKLPPDAIFLILPDKMPPRLEILEEIQVDFPRIFLILVGNRPEYALNAYQLGAIYYLMPPYPWKELERCYRRCVKIFMHAPVNLKIDKNHSTYTLPLANIIYMSVKSKKIYFYLKGQTDPFIACCSLGKVSENLHDQRFLQCQRSCIVNMDYVQKIQLDGVFLQNGKVLPLTKRNFIKLIRSYNNYLLGHAQVSRIRTGESAAVDLVRYKERLNLALRAAHICVFEVDLQKQLYTFFDNSEDIFGVSDDTILADLTAFAKLSPDEYRHAATSYFSHPDDSEVIAAAFRKVLAGHHASYEARMKAGCTKFIWCRLELQPILEDGVPVRMIGTIIALKRRTWQRKTKLKF